MPKKAFVKEVGEAISEELGVGEKHIYKLAKQLARKVQVSTEEAIYLLAAKNEINLNKFKLPKEKVDKIRELHLKSNPPVTSVSLQNSERKASTTTRQQTVHILGKEFNLTDPILPNRILKEAKEMSENVYPYLYVFENSIRELIMRIMKNKYGNNWWDTKVHKDIITEVQRRIKRDQNNPRHGKRGVHEIYYTDISHLGRIVQNNWSDFRDILPTIPWLTQRLEEISHSRNPVAHMNPLKKNDIDRIKVYFTDWQNQIKSRLPVIPE